MFPLAAIFEIGNKLIDKLIPDPEAKAKAQQELIKLQQEGRLAELNADNIEAQELTKRQQADMASDSWLSKNIRPMTLIAILGGYFIFASLSAGGVEIKEAYVKLLGEWGMLIMSFYFGGRTLEKIIDMKSKKWTQNYYPKLGLIQAGYHTWYIPLIYTKSIIPTASLGS